MFECHLLAGLLAIILPSLPGEQEARWWPQSVETRLALAKDNRQELVKALTSIPKEQQKGMVFLIENMPDSDLLNLNSSFLLTNHALAYKAKQQVPWGKDIPDELFFNNVLPYANLDEKRDPWRQAFFDQCMPMIATCKTPTEATQKLNTELFKTLKLKYAPQRRAPNLSPAESMAQGNASCTGLSIVLSDACRAVCIPTRIVGTPNWYDKRGNHTWLEIHDNGWHFTGACEPDPNGLDRGWFVGDAAKAKHDSPEHAIYATSFRKTALHFPLVWARHVTTVPGENITERYAPKEIHPSSNVRVFIKVVDQHQKRVSTGVTITSQADTALRLEGKSRGESADLNDILTFDLAPNKEFTIKAGTAQKTVKTGAAGNRHVVDFVVQTR